MLCDQAPCSEEQGGGENHARNNQPGDKMLSIHTCIHTYHIYINTIHDNGFQLQPTISKTDFEYKSMYVG